MKDIIINDHYLTWSEAVDHLVEQGVDYIGWANDGVPYPKGNPFTIRQGDFGTNTGVYYYPESNKVICVDMS